MTETIKFRKEFEEEIENFDETVKEAIYNATQKFIEIKNDKKSLRILWFMTIDSFRGVKELGLNLYGCESIEKMPKIPREILKKFREELFYQKSIRDDEFLNIWIIPECKDAYQNLLDTTEDTVLSVKVYNACYRLCKHFPKEEVQHTLFLLSCKNSNTCMFGGIRSLHFGREATELLMPYVDEVYQLLKAMSENYRKDDDFKIILDSVKITETFERKEKQEITSEKSAIEKFSIFKNFIQKLKTLFK